jgi:hypothetical protein
MMALVDRKTLEYLHTMAPAPSQASLDTMLTGVTNVRVIDGGMDGDVPLGTTVLLEESDPASVAAFRTALAIVEDPKMFGHCMCLGRPTVQLLAGDVVLATIGIHHGVGIRWAAWKYDAQLKDGQALRTWLALRGVPGPQQEYEESQRRAAEWEKAAAAWFEAMPPCLRPFWEMMQGFSVDLTPLREALASACPEQSERALALFQWFGSGAGPWSGFPMYEGVAENLLLEYPTSVLVAALDGAMLSRSHLEGAARYFAGWDFRRQKRKDRALLPAGLKQRLLEHALTSKDRGNIDRARRAFEG